MTSFRNADSVSVVSSSSGYGQSQATKKKKKKNLFVKFCNNDNNNKKDTGTLTGCQGGYTPINAGRLWQIIYNMKTILTARPN